MRQLESVLDNQNQQGDCQSERNIFELFSYLVDHLSICKEHILSVNFSCHCKQYSYTVDTVTNDLASARQKKSLVTESRWSQE